MMGAGGFIAGRVDRLEPNQFLGQRDGIDMVRHAVAFFGLSAPARAA
jgi:hypothetical protein